MTYHAWILRSYACDRSEKVALWIAKTYAQPPYNVAIDHNDSDFFPDPDDVDSTPLWWFKYFKRRFEEVPFTIVLLSTYLNQAEASEVHGLGVVREMLHVWWNADLRRPMGEFEQLQDIVVPLVASAGPLSLSTVDWPPDRAFVELLANRLRVEPG